MSHLSSFILYFDAFASKSIGWRSLALVSWHQETSQLKRTRSSWFVQKNRDLQLGCGWVRMAPGPLWGPGPSVVLASNAAPNDRSNLTASTCPWDAASCNAVWPRPLMISQWISLGLQRTCLRRRAPLSRKKLNRSQLRINEPQSFKPHFLKTEWIKTTSRAIGYRSWINVSVLFSHKFLVIKEKHWKCFNQPTAVSFEHLFCSWANQIEPLKAERDYQNNWWQWHEVATKLLGKNKSAINKLERFHDAIFS